MANQTLALRIQRPVFDTVGMASDAQTLRRNGMRNELEGLQLRDATEKSNALRGYREAARSGDPNALKKLAGYPEMQAQIHRSLASMKPDQRALVKKRANAIGSAAQYVMGFPPGSPERAQAWNAKIDELSGLGYIDQSQAQSYKESGPSDLILDQALSVNDFVKSYRSRNEGGVPENVAKVEKHMLDFRKSITPDFGAESPEVRDRIEQQMEAERARISSVYRLEEGLPTLSGGGPRSAGGKGDAAIPQAGLYDPTQGEGKQAGRALKGSGEPPAMRAGNRSAPESHRDAPTPQSREEFDALPSGAPFINPADGRFLFKK